MDRRTFLQLLPGLPACGTSLFIANAVSGATADFEGRCEPMGNADGPAIIRAASFHSDLWGQPGVLDYRERAWPPSQWSEFQQEALHKIQPGRLFVDGSPVPDLAIALAHPDDPLSWNAAIEECRRAKTAGAVTLLLAARPYPHYPLSPRAQARQASYRLAEDTGILIGITTIDAYATLANALILFTNSCNTASNLDFADIRSVTNDAREGFLFNGSGYGHSMETAACNVCRQISRHLVLGQRIRGAVIFLELDTAANVETLRATFGMFATTLPENALIAYSLGRSTCTSSFSNVSALLTI